MSKAILVIDMPNKCIECPLLNEYFGTLRCNKYCNAIEKELFVDIYSDKPEWCPLREVPKKDNYDYGYDEYHEGIQYGWNNCIETILDELPKYEEEGGFEDEDDDF